MKAADFSPTDLKPADPNRWRERAIALAAVAAPILVLFGPALFSDRLFAMRDAGHYYYPLFKWCADEWGAGRIPLWNPLENCGTAVHADPTASIWYPGKLIFALPLDFTVSYKLYIVGHVALCAWTAYWLARKWGASRYAAALAALSYSCGGSVVFQHCNVVYLVGAAWLPVAAGLVDDVLREQRVTSAVWLGVVLALMVLGGDPQMAYHVLLIALIYSVVLFARRNPDRVQQRRLRRSTVWGGVVVAGAAAIAFCLAAIQILPSAEAVSESERAVYDLPRNLYESADYLSAKWQASGPQHESLREVRDGLLGPPDIDMHAVTAYDFSVGPWRLAELVWPNIGGRMFPTHRRWFSLFAEESRIWSPTLYFGLLPLVLGLSVFSLRSDDSRVLWLAWIVLFFGLGSLGTFGLGWLIRLAYTGLLGDKPYPPIGDGVGGVYWLFVVVLPKYVLFRYPAKLLVVASLGISQLAAIGWDRALAEPQRRLIWILRLLGGASAIATLGALVAAQFVVIGEGAADPVFGPFDSRGAWTDVLSSLAQAAILSLAFAWLLEKASGVRQPPEAVRWTSRLAPAAALVLCAFELTVANWWLVPIAPASIWREPSAVTAAIGPTDSSPRIYRTRTWWPAEFARKSSARRMEKIVRWERDSLAGRYALLSNLGVVNAQEGIKAADHEYLVDRLAMITSEDIAIPATRALEELLSAEFLLLPHNLEVSLAERSTAPGLPPDTTLWRMKNTNAHSLDSKEVPSSAGNLDRVRQVPHSYSLVASHNQRFQDWAEVEGSLHANDNLEHVAPDCRHARP